MRKTELDEFFVRAPRPEPHQFNLTDCVSRGAGACAAERVEDCPPPAHASMSPLAVRTFRSLSSAAIALWLVGPARIITNVDRASTHTHGI
jgi:hypothetical protein